MPTKTSPFAKTVHTQVRPPSGALSGAYVYVPEPPKKRPPVLLQVTGVLIRRAYRHRWPLLPAWGTLVVLHAGRTDPFAAVWVLLALGFILALWAHLGRPTPGAPRVLSTRERWLGAVWCGLALAWSAWMLAMPGVDLRLAAGVLVLLVAVPSWKWAFSRVVRSGLSAEAKRYAQDWRSGVASQYGPTPLQGSVVDEDSWTEPAEGAHSFTVRLAAGVHAKKAATAEVRMAVEEALLLPHDTVELVTVREDVKLLQVTLTPARHLERQPAAWPGPVLNEDGSVPLAVGQGGEEISVQLWNKDGVEHVAVFGTTGTGKSSTVAALTLPGPRAGVETLWILDGGGGSSVPYLEPASDWYATRPAQWAAALDSAHAILVARKERRGAEGIHRWRGPDVEEDPILTLLIEEATTVKAKLPARYEGIVLELEREARKHGIRIIQVAQDPAGDGLLGGRKARDLMSLIIAHRPGGGMAARMSLDSTSDETVDLLALPPKPGFAAIVNLGRVLSACCRVLFAKDSDAGAEARAVDVRPLVGGDRDAAGEAYARRGDVSPGVPAGATVVTEGVIVGASEGHVSLTKAAEEKRTVKERVREALAAQPEPVTRQQLVDLIDGSTTSVQRALSEMESDGEAERAGKQRWQMKAQVSHAA